MKRIYPEAIDTVVIDQLDNNDLKITLTEHGKDLLSSIIKDETRTEGDIIEQMLQYFLDEMDEEYVFEEYVFIDATYTGYGMTTCNCIIERHSVDNYDTITDLWWYPDYQIHSIPNKLLEQGFIILRHEVPYYE